jgi:hypothetical protein
MKQKKRLWTSAMVILLFLISMTPEIQAQTINLTRPVITPVSPEAAAVQKYASYPVNYSTGIPDITIPLYEIKVGDIVLPVTLTYHSSGLKPREPSGRVGTGWTLNAEPSIMRTVKGLPDDAGGRWGHAGYFYQKEYIALKENNHKEYIRRLIDKEYDGESDIYSYQLNPGGGTALVGRAAEFTYVNELQMATFPRNNDKVIALFNSGLSGFRIENGNGLIYNFGEGDIAKEPGRNVCTRWVCNNITSRSSNARIDFTYQPVYPQELIDIGINDMVIIEEPDLPNGYTYLIKNDGYVTTTQKWVGVNQLLPASSDLYSLSQGHTTSRVERRGVESILFNGHQMTFHYDNAKQDLTQIFVTTADGKQIRNIEFFVTPYSEHTLLTKLDSVRISAPNCEVRTYRFDYYDPAMVPNLDTRNIDHWGFYNGPHGTGGGVPTITTPVKFYDQTGQAIKLKTTIEGRNREPDHSYTQTGMLLSIMHPEGTRTLFEYEGNSGAFHMYYHGSDYDTYGHYLWPVGGMRIDRITESIVEAEVPINISRRVFSYGLSPYSFNVPTTGEYVDTPIMGGGAIKHIVTDKDYCFEYNKSVATSSGGSIESRMRTWNSMPISDITFNNGSAVIYSYVEEYKEDMLNHKWFKSKYYYAANSVAQRSVQLDWDDQYYPTKLKFDMDAYPSLLRKRVDQPYDISDMNQDSYQEYGHLIREEHYNGDNILVASTDYEYGMNSLDSWSQTVTVNKPYRTKDVYPYVPDGSGPSEETKRDRDVYADSEREPITNYFTDAFRWKSLALETHKAYFYNQGQQEVVETSKTYDYGSWVHINPIKVTNYHDDKTIEDIYTYYNDLYYNSSFNLVNVLIQHEHVVNDDSIISVVDFDGTARPQKIQYKTNQMNVFDDKVVYDKYDAYGNVAEISANDGKHTCYIWSYKNQYPVAEIDNATYSQILQALSKDESWMTSLGNKEEPSGQDMDLINGLRGTLSSSHITTFTYKPLIGLTSITNPAGATVYHESDNFGRLIRSYRMENGVKQLLTEHQYHLSDASGIASPYGDFAIAGINIPQGTILTDNQYVTFETTIQGGSGQFLYEWSLYKAPGYNEIDRCSYSTSNPANLRPVYVASANPKMNYLKLVVYDVRLDKEKEFYTWFYVKSSN